jgi:hypothetical protein
MGKLQISYGTYAFDQTGIPQYGVTLAPENTNVPLKSTLTYRIKHRFFETSFADNEARLATLKVYMANNPRATLTVLDENGGAIAQADVKFAGFEVGEEWGQFRREVTCRFECFSNLLIGGQSATFTPAGSTAVILPSILHWEGGVRTERYTGQVNNRKVSTETITATGRVLVDPTMTQSQKRDYLLRAKDTIESIANFADGVLCFGASAPRTMRVEDVKADIGDTQEELTWTATFSQWIFPTGTYAEMDYEVDFSDDWEKGIRTITLSGKVLATTREGGEAAATALMTSYATGRTLLLKNLKHRELNGADGDPDFGEVTFSFRFEESLSVISVELKVSTKTDRRSGMINTTYSGRVHAIDAATAIATARSVGYGKGTILMGYSEDIDTLTTGETSPADGVAGTGGNTTFIGCVFSYEYQSKDVTVVAAQVSIETSNERFGACMTTISGSVTASTAAAASSFAANLKMTGVIVRSEKDTPSTTTIQVEDGTGGVLFNKLDFSYSYAAMQGNVSASYGIDIDNDYQKREVAVTIAGTVFGSDIDNCRAMIAALTTTPAVPTCPTGLVMTRSRENDTYETQNAEDQVTLLKEMPFSQSFVGVMQDSSANGLILEADFSVDTTYPVLKAQIDEIPFGKPYIQKDVTTTIGLITVVGNVCATSQSAADTWALDKKQYATGCLDAVQMRRQTQFAAMNGTTPTRYRTEFTFTARGDTSLTVGGPASS